MNSVQDQQPIRRTVGKRASREGRALTPEDRAAMTKMAQYRTRAPKGVFIYGSAELASETDVFADDKRYAIRINDEFTAL